MDAKDVAAILVEGAAGVLQGKQTLGEARNISTESLESIYGVAYGWYQQGKYAEALKSFELLCLYDHQNPRFWTGLGYCRQQLKDYSAAASALSYAELYADTPDLEMYLNLAQCFMASGHNEAAEAYVDAVLWGGDADQTLKDRAQLMKDQLSKE